MANPVSTIAKRKYRCKFLNCGKTFACKDGVRRHAKQRHPAWLSQLDLSKLMYKEAAKNGSREHRKDLRQIETSYCTESDGESQGSASDFLLANETLDDSDTPVCIQQPAGEASRALVFESPMIAEENESTAAAASGTPVTMPRSRPLNFAFDIADSHAFATRKARDSRLGRDSDSPVIMPRSKPLNFSFDSAYESNSETDCTQLTYTWRQCTMPPLKRGPSLLENLETDDPTDDAFCLQIENGHDTSDNVSTNGEFLDSIWSSVVEA